MTLPKLKVKEVTYRQIDHKDLDRFVRAHYPALKNYSFVAVEECGNDSRHPFAVSGNLSDWDLVAWQYIEAREDGSRTLDASNWLVLNKLCADGHIPPGNYLVDVCW